MKEKQQKSGWFSCLMGYIGDCKGKLRASVILSVISVVSGLVPYFCFYKILEAFISNTAGLHILFMWSLIALAAYTVKVLFFGLSTGLSHNAAYNILEQLRLRVADRFMHAPLGNVTQHSIGEIKNTIVDKIENIEPPLAHMVPEGAGHVVLPVVSFIAVAMIDWRVALSSLITLPLSLVCMVLTFKISGRSFEKYNESNASMSSAIVEYIEGIEVIKAFGREGSSYEKFSRAITDYRWGLCYATTAASRPPKRRFA